MSLVLSSRIYNKIFNDVFKNRVEHIRWLTMAEMPVVGKNVLALKTSTPNYEIWVTSIKNGQIQKSESRIIPEQRYLYTANSLEDIRRYFNDVTNVVLNAFEELKCEGIYVWVRQFSIYDPRISDNGEWLLESIFGMVAGRWNFD